jgi:diguanylate cyclase (GGDEF)-like protein
MTQKTLNGGDRGQPTRETPLEADTYASIEPPAPAPPARPHAPPERFRALESADPMQQLRDALEQIDALLYQNARLKQDVIALGLSLRDARHLALHDELTGLANRRLLQDRFQQAIARPDVVSSVALAFVDLDGFKRVNDTLGHATGDRLLRLVAQRLMGGVRDCDTVCRFGGDEFVVLLAGIEGRKQAHAAIKHLNERLAAPYRIDGVEARITASIGLALYPCDGEDFGSLVEVSDLAMSQNKARMIGAQREDRITHESQPASPFVERP